MPAFDGFIQSPLDGGWLRLDGSGPYTISSGSPTPGEWLQLPSGSWVRQDGSGPYSRDLESNTFTALFPSPGPDAPLDTRPRFGLGSASSWQLNPAALLAGMSPIPGSENDGRSGTFSLQTTTGNYGWVAVRASVTTAGLHFFDGVGFGGWSGAGMAGNNTGDTFDPSTSSVLFTDANGVQWRFFRQDYVNAQPFAADYQIS